MNMIFRFKKNDGVWLFSKHFKKITKVQKVEKIYHTICVSVEDIKFFDTMDFIHFQKGYFITPLPKNDNQKKLINEHIKSVRDSLLIT